MKKEILFNICIFLVCLVISLPFFSANAMASNIISAHAQGQDQIPSYRMPADFTEIIVDATIDDDPAIGETQLAVSQLLITQFDECKQLTLDGIYRCTYKSNNNIKQGSTIFTIDLMDDEGLVVDTKTTEITVDDQEPEIELFEIQQNQNNFTASYKITDSACLGIGCEGKCSGFKKIEFYSNEELLKKLEVNSFSGICTLEGSEKLEVPQGDNTINMLVYDNLDNIATSETIEMKIDLQAPKVLATIDIFDAQGYKVTVLGKTETTGNILKAYIQDDNLDPKTVYADISELISDYYDTSTAPFNIYNKKPATKCEETQSNVWECEWFGLILAVKSDGEKTLTIEASDTNNHKATSSVYYLLSVDKSDSQATLLRSSFKKDGNYYLGPEGNTITLEVTEDISGFTKGEVYLDLAPLLGTEYAKVRTQGCLKQDTIWNCEWKDVSTTEELEDGAQIQLGLVTPSVNDVGNPITGEVTNTFIYDSSIPVITSSKQETSTGMCPVSGDTITYTFEVLEHGSKDLNIIANATRISTHKALKEGECIETGTNKWRCVVEIDALTSFARDQAEVYFTISDRVGNFDVVTMNTDICAIDKDGTPNCIDGVSSSLNNVLPNFGIDRRAASYENARYRVYQKLEIGYATSGEESETCEIIEKKVNKCEATLSSLLSTPYMITQDESSSLLAMEFNHESFPDAELKNNNFVEVVCNISFKVKAGLIFYNKPEFETAVIDVPVTGNALKTPSEEIQRRLQEATDNIATAKAEHEDDVAWDEWFKWQCDIAQSAGLLFSLKYIGKAIKYAAAYSSVESTLNAAAKADPTPTAKASNAAVKAVQGAMCFSDNYQRKYLVPISWPSGWLAQIWAPMIYGSFLEGALGAVGLLNKIFCSIHHCMFAYELDDAEIDLKGYKEKHEDNVLTIETPDGPETINPLSKLKNSYSYRLDPYKSIHSAELMTCVSAEKFNSYKKKQIACIRKRCLLDAAEKGLTFHHCEEQYKAQQCLYIDSAAYTVNTNHVSGIFSGDNDDSGHEWATLGSILLLEASATAYHLYCGSQYKEAEVACAKIAADQTTADIIKKDPTNLYWCFAWLGVNILAELIVFEKFDNYLAEDYNSDVNYCEGIE